MGSDVLLQPSTLQADNHKKRTGFGPQQASFGVYVSNAFGGMSGALNLAINEWRAGVAYPEDKPRFPRAATKLPLPERQRGIRNVRTRAALRLGCQRNTRGPGTQGSNHLLRRVQEAIRELSPQDPRTGKVRPLW